MAKRKSKTKKAPSYPEKTKDIPATVGMLYLVRDELKSDISSLRHDMNSRFAQVDARFAQIDARFAKVEARFAQVDARFDKVDSRLDKVDSRLDEMMSKMHQMHLLAEEQNARNKIVMDGLTSLFIRQERSEERTDSIEKFLAGLK